MEFSQSSEELSQFLKEIPQSSGEFSQSLKEFPPILERMLLVLNGILPVLR
jgi:hypothetical protein